MDHKAVALDKETIAGLITEAFNMRKFSYCPYSGFSVGAALLTKEGKIYRGCNIENAAYSVSICAERTALFRAVSEGERNFKAIAVVGGKEQQPEGYAFPCGTCRQALREFCDHDVFAVIAARSPEDYRIYTLDELIPVSFGPGNLI